VIQAGLYRVQIRIGHYNSSSGASLSFKIDGTNVSTVYASTYGSYYSSTGINEIFELKAGARLQLYNSSMINLVGEQQFNVFSMEKL
jgi:hypothetical protein